MEEIRLMTSLALAVSPVRAGHNGSVDVRASGPCTTQYIFRSARPHRQPGWVARCRVCAEMSLIPSDTE